MNPKQLLEAFQKEFDVVGIIKTEKYINAANESNHELPKIEFNSMVVVGLAYPKRVMVSNEDYAYASFYTFGQDYHTVLKQRILKVMTNFDVKYDFGVDNHLHDERLAASLAGVGYVGKNQLIINKDHGSYHFLGIIFVDIDDDYEVIHESLESCGDCRICIDSCPTHALSINGYDQSKCISNYNQEKRALTSNEIKLNYCLFGCDICQLVCPKNIPIKRVLHSEFDLSGKEAVSYKDLFSLSEREFKEKYDNMAYLWKGKTILMRNALTLLLRQKNTKYNDLIKDSLKKYEVSWYQETAKFILEKLEETKESN
ncbi:MAG TPA: DUF1730 domain-containing protein [Bacillota bacterium]|nr:DUF1730 domain-containing protein [Bacillota bacterium]